MFDRQMRGEAAVLGRALARGVADVWQRDGEAAARQFLDTAASQSERAPGALGLARRQGPRCAARPARRARADRRRTRSSPSAIRRAASCSRTSASRCRSAPARSAARSRSRSRSSSSTSTSRRRCARRSIGSVSAVAIAALLALGLGVVFIGRPISRLAAKARRVGTGDLTGPLQLAPARRARRARERDQPDVRAAAEERRAREQATEQLRHADRLTTVGKLASGLAHELGTPLNVVRGPREADRRPRGRGRGRRWTPRGSSSSRPSG